MWTGLSREPRASGVRAAGGAAATGVRPVARGGRPRGDARVAGQCPATAADGVPPHPCQAPPRRARRRRGVDQRRGVHRRRALGGVAVRRRVQHGTGQRAVLPGGEPTGERVVPRAGRPCDRRPRYRQSGCRRRRRPPRRWRPVVGGLADDVLADRRRRGGLDGGHLPLGPRRGTADGGQCRP